MIHQLIASSSAEALGIGTLIALFGVLLVVYFIPTMVAMIRHHHNTLAIFFVNLFLGWSGIGWGVALVWACMRDRQQLENFVKNLP
jgi:hypothetical protein